MRCSLSLVFRKSSLAEKQLRNSNAPLNQISTDDFWETSTQRIDAFDGDLFGGNYDNYDDAINIFGEDGSFGEEPFLDEDGNVIPTTIPPTDCGESGNCFDGFGDGGGFGDYDEDDQVSLSACFSKVRG